MKPRIVQINLLGSDLFVKVKIRARATASEVLEQVGFQGRWELLLTPHGPALDTDKRLDFQDGAVVFAKWGCAR